MKQPIWVEDFADYNKRRRKRNENEGLGLQEMLKSKEFKERVTILKTGAKKIGDYLKKTKGGKK